MIYVKKKYGWANYCVFCTDGGKSMSGCYTALHGRIKEVAPHVAWSHCCFHRQPLATKPLPDSLKEVLNQSVKGFNCIKTNSTTWDYSIFVWRDGQPPYDITSTHRSEVALTKISIHKIGWIETWSSSFFSEDHPFELHCKFHESEWRFNSLCIYLIFFQK